MLNNIKSAIASYIANVRGWKTSRKIIVIESDDWGMLRMASVRVKENLMLKKKLMKKKQED